MERSSQASIWAYFIAAIALIPLALILTFVAHPFWGWVEQTMGIEALGHSGPAEWCYLAVYVFLLSDVSVVIWVLSRKRE